MIWKYITLLVLLLVIIYQDFKYRGVTWIVLLLFCLNAVIIRLEEWPFILLEELIKIGFLTVNFIALLVFFSIKQRSIIRLTNNYIGSGDIIFIVGVSFLFSPINFIVAFILSMFFSLIISVILSKILMLNKLHIPLAGLVGAQLSLLLIGKLFFHYNLYKDSWLSQTALSHGIF